MDRYVIVLVNVNGDSGYIGVHSKILSSLYMFEIFHAKILEGQKEWRAR